MCALQWPAAGPRAARLRPTFLPRACASSTRVDRRSATISSPATYTSRTWRGDSPKTQWPARFAAVSGVGAGYSRTAISAGAPGASVPSSGSPWATPGEPCALGELGQRPVRAGRQVRLLGTEESGLRLGEHVTADSVGAQCGLCGRSRRAVNAHGVVHVAARVGHDGGACRADQRQFGRVHVDAVGQQRGAGEQRRRPPAAARPACRTWRARPVRRPRPRPHGCGCRPPPSPRLRHTWRASRRTG